MICDRNSFLAAVDEAKALLREPPYAGTREHAHFMRLLAELDHYLPDEPSLVAKAKDLGPLAEARTHLTEELETFRARFPRKSEGPPHGDSFAFGRDLH